MKYLLFILVTTLSIRSYSQAKSYQRQIQIQIGSSVHGTGDIRGLAFATEYGQYFKKRLSYNFSLGGTIHDGAKPIFFNDPMGNPIDGSIRYTTAGFQAIGHLGYNIFRTLNHELQVRGGVLLRYQSSSYYDIVVVLYPIGTGLPIPVNYFINESRQRTFAIGGSTQIIYNYTFNNAIFIGLLAGFQADTNGDNLLQTTFTIGKRF